MLVLEKNAMTEEIEKLVLKYGNNRSSIHFLTRNPKEEILFACAKLLLAI
jgi:hypothetical protein